MTLTITQISQLYVSLFGRASEGEGNQYWQTRSTGTDMSAIADRMLATEAAKDYLGETLDNNQAFIEQIYLNALGKTRADDSEGIDFWTNQLDSGKTKGQVVEALVTAVQFPENAGAAQDLFANKVEVSTYAADHLPDCHDLDVFSNFIDRVTNQDATISAAFNDIDTVAASFSSPSLPHGQVTLASDIHLDWVDSNEIKTIPHAAIGQVIYTADGQSVIGTGFMISPEHVLTSAHVLLDDDGNLNARAGITFIPGLNGDVGMAQGYNWQHVWVQRTFDETLYPQWPDNDLGIIQLSQPVASTTGYLSLEPELHTGLTGSSVHSAGYSAGQIEQENPATPGQDYYQWEVSGTIDRYLFDSSAVKLSTSMDVSGGASGSPIYYTEDEIVYFTGVLSGTLGGSTVGAAMDQDSYNWILGIVQPDGYYTDYAAV